MKIRQVPSSRRSITCSSQIFSYRVRGLLAMLGTYAPGRAFQAGLSLTSPRFYLARVTWPMTFSIALATMAVMEWAPRRPGKYAMHGFAGACIGGRLASR